METGEGGGEGWGDGEGWGKRQKTVLEQQLKKREKEKRNITKVAQLQVAPENTRH